MNTYWEYIAFAADTWLEGGCGSWTRSGFVGVCAGSSSWGVKSEDIAAEEKLCASSESDDIAFKSATVLGILESSGLGGCCMPGLVCNSDAAPVKWKSQPLVGAICYPNPISCPGKQVHIWFHSKAGSSQHVSYKSFCIEHGSDTNMINPSHSREVETSLNMEPMDATLSSSETTCLLMAKLLSPIWKLQWSSTQTSYQMRCYTAALRGRLNHCHRGLFQALENISVGLEQFDSCTSASSSCCLCSL